MPLPLPGTISSCVLHKVRLMAGEPSPPDSFPSVNGPDVMGLSLHSCFLEGMNSVERQTG